MTDGATHPEREWLDREIRPLIPELARLANGILGNAADAGDAVGNVLEAVVRVAGRAPKPDNVRAYLRRSVIHECNRIKASRYNTVPFDLERLDIAMRGPKDVDREAALVVYDALQSLPVSEARAFALIHVYEYRYAEASQILGVAPGTLHGQVRRAKAKILDQLTSDPDSGEA